ncbi:hypothetical protein OsI_33943 [Oryza sativa Indica Group]|uniref:Uncharacterized protein n=3 Tax=Oryza sativa TaxID=4530 RepID=A0A979HJ33_ORYSJ|nr:E3 ubiquitin-protein ligase XB3-like [Oryza sativa Japonica Group]AAN05513.1 hypothetical protein [Oryza sativa Japonica Group]AAP54182.1 RING zinc finger ankyrin protein, putative [Oryza sativa Japonica Group]EAY78838.1 hypothetical protein OsI_33943 [Oryza sativa Indica Group]EAZ16357.1 hypothetical protein OsJ_31820 [Oryza sativa Japonica Group]
MVCPSPLKFIGELEPEAKALLEAALMEANREREKKILNGTKYSLPSPLPGDDSADDDACSEVSDMELCCICFDQACTIEVAAVTAIASVVSAAVGAGAAATIN